MSQQNLIPVLPESAPFTPEQRAYLNGFFAGLWSRGNAEGIPVTPGPVAKPLAPLTILFGSQTGNAENLAKRIAKAAGQRGFAPTIQDLAQYPSAQLASEKAMLVITSTFGDGEPPDNAKSFWEFLRSESAPPLTATRFSLCALGDTNYPKFCAFGKELDARLAALGGTRAHPMAECDVDYEEPFQQWLTGALTALASESVISKPVISAHSAPLAHRASVSSIAEYSRSRPFPAPLLANQRLNAPGSEKDTRHFEFSLAGSGLVYEAGDALGVRPANCPESVVELLRTLGCSGEESVSGGQGQDVSLREALLHHYEITRIPLPLLQSVAAQTGDAELLRVAAPGANGELGKFLWGREIIDLLAGHPGATFKPAEFIALLKKLQPRLYSISSSPKAHPGQVHLCVGVVRYDSLGRARKGVCSTFLAERVPAGGEVPVFVHGNKNFRPPAKGDTPMIMVGPGTGIAPFRAFLGERCAVGATGKNWLFFGDQRAELDFLYRAELEGLRRDGLLNRLDVAFSRDQEKKIYVQHRMLEHAAELFAWLESGAHFYVCGDANRMAKDVDAALQQVIATAGQKNAEQAGEYVQRLKAEKRYQRDVY
jgi:sulfite reductase (NADPH) flavoprotein alpha-component